MFCYQKGSQWEDFRDSTEFGHNFASMIYIVSLQNPEFLMLVKIIYIHIIYLRKYSVNWSLHSLKISLSHLFSAFHAKKRGISRYFLKRIMFFRLSFRGISDGRSLRTTGKFIVLFLILLVFHLVCLHYSLFTPDFLTLN